jgi:adenylate kinase
MGKTAIVTGIPGTGKTTVCNFVEKLGKKAGIQISTITYGTVMVEILQKQGRLTERDAMRKDNIETQHKLQREVAEAIAGKVKHSGGITIIDTHMSIKTPSGYMPGLPHHVLQLLKPELLVLVEAQPSEIAGRRMKDATRRRDDATQQAVEEELMFSRLYAGACAVLSGAAVKTVINADGKQEDAAKEVLEALGVV